MSEHKLRKIIEHNNRLKEQLELPRIPVSQASESLIEFTRTTKDYLIPSQWGPPPHDPFASQTGGSCGCSVMRYVKHASLVERCFPVERTEDSVPSSNELSYLLYYVQSKPAKAAKVGAYLSKRIAKDIQRRRRPDVCIGLRIYDALLDACASNLGFFAKDVLGTLDTVLAADDLELIKRATRTFALFCRGHTGTTLAIDKDLCSLYSHLIRTFVAYVQVPSESADHSTTTKLAFGLCALQAIANSQATYADDCYYELPLVSTAVASRIAVAPAIEPAPVTDIEDQVSSINTDEPTLITDSQLGQWAWRCAYTLLCRSHGQHSHIIVSEIFHYLDGSLEWQPISLCTRIVLAVVSQLQPQSQNMVIVEILAFLTDGALKSQLYVNSTSYGSKAEVSERRNAKRQACTIRILERLFCKPYVLVGISVMEALNVLVSFLLESVTTKQLGGLDKDMFNSALQTAVATGSDSRPQSVGAVSDAAVASGSTVHSSHMSDYYHLLAAIGGLAKHQYYTGQLSDMIEHLISRMVLVNAKDPGELLVWLLQALYIVLHTSRHSTIDGTKPLSLRAAAPLFALLTHENADCRVLAADCIAEIFSALTEATLYDQPDSKLVGAIYYQLGHALKGAHLQPQRHLVAGYAGAAAILRQLLCLQDIQRRVQYTVALIDSCAPSSGTASWATLLAMVWAQISRIHSHNALEAHVNKTTSEFKDMGLWESSIEHVCLHQMRAAEIGSYESPSLVSLPTNSTTAASKPSQSTETKLAEQLSIGTVLDIVRPELAAQCADYEAERAALELWAVNSDAANRELCQVYANAGADSPLNAVDQVKDIRARVSVDWDVHVRHDSIVAPHINVEQLRTALRDGLAMYASDQEAGRSLGHSPNSRPQSPLIMREGAMTHHSRDVLATMAQYELDSDSDVGDGDEADRPAVPAEVRNLLDSIDDFDQQPHIPTAGKAPADSHSTPGVSTPVIYDGI
ncbi:plasma membrane localization protein [Coemansia sp. RSA 2336]|nr:plasma membrane localization protein [Coemansia sp. RSA 2336]